MTDQVEKRVEPVMTVNELGRSCGGKWAMLV